MEIQRHPGQAQGRCRAVAWNGLVFAVATAPEKTSSVSDQTRQTLAEIDRHLTDAGSDRSRLLSATVYVSDMAHKAEMDAVWCQWLGSGGEWPQRACVQAGLAPGTLVEITVVAAGR
jgi:enamine deaminase RidA (YjgF/YER057c/UK114 family)